MIEPHEKLVQLNRRIDHTLNLIIKKKINPEFIDLIKNNYTKINEYSSSELISEQINEYITSETNLLIEMINPFFSKYNGEKLKPKHRSVVEWLIGSAINDN